jgi:hypothetical protein
MVRLLKWSGVVLAGWLVGACLGGQTGEPVSLDCNSSAATWRQSVDGVSPERLALAYQGEHRAKLHWSKDAASVTQPVTLTIDSREQSGTIGCIGQLSVPATFSLHAKDGTVIEAGEGSLSAPRGKLQPAALTGSGQHFRIVGNLSEEAGEVTVSGTLEPRPDAATEGSADFSSEFSGVAGAGGLL